MNYNQTLRSLIEASIKTPADPKITGSALQEKLLDIVSAIDSGGILLGEAIPSTIPSTEANCFFLATTQGTYTNFIDSQGNAISIVAGEAAILSSFIQGNASIRWKKLTIITPSTPNGYVAYAVAQDLDENERSTALNNIGAAIANGENPDLIAGDIIPKSSSPIVASNLFNIQTTGGDVDLKSGASSLKSIRGNLDGKMNPFLADEFVSTGMNLVDPEQTLTIGGRTAYYFPIAKGTFGSYGTTQENNGYIVVGDTPYAVYYSELKPTVSEYGAALTPVNSNGKKYYTTTGYGWLVVVMNSGSEVPAVHVAWSNYQDSFGGVFGNTVKRIAPFVQWIHPWGMAGLFGSNRSVFDEIDIAGQVCYRRIDRVALNTLDWTMTTVPFFDAETETVTYTHVFSATVTGMKNGGLYQHNLSGMEVSGPTVSFRSTEITTVPEFVIWLGSTMIYYELATVVQCTFSQVGYTLSENTVSNDFGLTYFLNEGEIAGVAAFVIEEFSQNGKDPLFNAVTYQKILAEVLAAVLCQLNERVGNLETKENVECVNLTVKRRASIFGWNETDGAPVNASATGNKGDYYISTDYLYICVGNNTWKKIALSTI